MCLTKVIKKEKTLNVKGCEITLSIPVRICTKCGEEILDEKLDDETLELYYKAYEILKERNAEFSICNYSVKSE